MSKVYKLVIWGIFICAFFYAFFMYFYSSSGHEKINFGEVESVILYKDKYSSKVPDDNVSKVLDIIEKNNVRSRYRSNVKYNDKKIDYEIKLFLSDGSSKSIYVFENSDNYYFSIDDKVYKTYDNTTIFDLASLFVGENFDEFYDDEILKVYEKLDKLDRDYNGDIQKDAIMKLKTNVEGEKYDVINRDKVIEFLDKYKGDQSAFMRLFKGAPETSYVYDIKYDSESDKFIVMEDSSRGYYISKTVSYNEYSEVSFSDDCLVLYNDDTDKIDLCKPYYGVSYE